MDITGQGATVVAAIGDLGTEAALVGTAAVALSLAIWGLGFLVRKGKGLAR